MFKKCMVLLIMSASVIGLKGAVSQEWHLLKKLAEEEDQRALDKELEDYVSVKRINEDFKYRASSLESAFSVLSSENLEEDSIEYREKFKKLFNVWGQLRKDIRMHLHHSNARKELCEVLQDTYARVIVPLGAKISILEENQNSFLEEQRVLYKDPVNYASIKKTNRDFQSRAETLSGKLLALNNLNLEVGSVDYATARKALFGKWVKLKEDICAELHPTAKRELHDVLQDTYTRIIVPLGTAIATFTNKSLMMDDKEFVELTAEQEQILEDEAHKKEERLKRTPMEAMLEQYEDEDFTITPENLARLEEAFAADKKRKREDQEDGVPFKKAKGNDGESK